ncbi:MAG: BtpA family membrane complex biogenesis protein [Clostridiales bacterium]|nr:BtpA family membrane complex biogenesis protein [Clostridiales bacterium]
MFKDLNGKKLVIGLVHLLPMPGTAQYEEGNLDKMTRKAIQDCQTLKANGADGGLLQSVDNVYPVGDDTDYARVATLAMVAARVRDAVGPDFKMGVQLMWNCITPSLAVAKATGADFIRCTALVGSTPSPFGGVINADPLKVMEYRAKINAKGVAMLAEVSGYHFKGEYSPENIRNLAGMSMRVGADAVEVLHSDEEMNERLVKDVKAVGPIPVILGGGTNVENCKRRLRYADGALVGSAFEGGKWGGPVVGEIVAEYVRKIRELEEELAKDDSK